MAGLLGVQWQKLAQATLIVSRNYNQTLILLGPYTHHSILCFHPTWPSPLKFCVSLSSSYTDMLTGFRAPSNLSPFHFNPELIKYENTLFSRHLRPHYQVLSRPDFWRDTIEPITDGLSELIIKEQYPNRHSKLPS